jgi:hypothetical protein
MLDNATRISRVFASQAKRTHSSALARHSPEEIMIRRLAHTYGGHVAFSCAACRLRIANTRQRSEIIALWDRYLGYPCPNPASLLVL